MLKLAMGSALLVTATQVVAVSLGATQGSVIIGRPLDLLVQTSITASEAASGLCLDAELLYGDVRVPATAITTAIQQIGGDGRGVLRIRSTEPVNEPIVTLILRAGCATSFRRSYTLLADVEPRAPAALPPSTVQLTPAPRPAGPAVPIPAPRSSGPSAAAGSPVSTPAQAPLPESLPPETPIRLSEPAPRPAAVTRMLSKTRPLPTVVPSEPDAQADRQVSGPVEQPAVTVPAGPRLQLDPVDLSVRSGAPSTTEASAETSQSGPVSLAEPGQAESAQAQTVTPDSDSQQALQQEVEALRAEQERMRLALETLNNQLRDAQSSRNTVPWGYGAAGLAILLLGGYWFALRSRRRSETTLADRNAAPWWESALPDTATASDEARAVPPESKVISQPLSAPAVAVPSGALSSWASESVEGMEVAEGRESMFQEVPVAPLDIERLQDLWQRVEFCESIGQYRDAMIALKAFVIDSPRASEAAYLLWLKIASLHGNEADLTAASSCYESHFQRLAPALPAIESPLGLDDDASCVQSLVRQWPSEAVREVLVATLSSQPGDAQSTLTVRTIRAFDDLIMLVGMLDTLPTLDSAPVSSEPVDEKDSLDDLEMEFPTWQSVADIPPTPKPEPGAMLDFDLSGMSDPPSIKPVQTVKPDPQSVDFDLFQLEPKTEQPKGEGPGGSDRKG